MRKPNHCPQQKAFNCKGAYFIFDGPNTTCIVNAGNEQFEGIARCNPVDTWEESIGMGWAYLRAMRKLLSGLEENLLQSR